jgi:hypothetical protein
MTRLKLVSLLVALAGLVTLTGGEPPGPAAGNEFPAPFVPGEVLIRFAPEAGAIQTEDIRIQLGADQLHRFLSGGLHWKLGPGISVEEAIARFQDHPAVQHIEPNYLLEANLVPNDPRLDELYGMINTGQTGGTPDADIDADMAWSVSTGDSGIVVAVIDTGIDYNHPDLAANMWTNPGEIPDNGIDDDGNGYVDDVHGYDFVNDDGDPFDDHSHGTHCAGTIGAVGDNGIGVVGVNWDVSLMAVKFLNSGGSGSTADAVLSVDYATTMGANLTSNSWGGGGYSQELYDAIARANAQDIAFVAAAGNGYGTNTDTNPHYPSSYDLPNVISVMATDHDDAVADFSNYGPTSVDLGAPGEDILSTTPANSYGLKSGTSMATPHAAGVCALILSVNPNIPVSQMKQVLLDATDPIPSLAGQCVSEGRLNAFFAIAEPDVDPPGMIDDLATTEATSNTMYLSWTATGDDGEVGTASYYELRFSTAPIDDSSWDLATRAGNEPAPEVSGTPQSMEVFQLEAETLYYFAIKAFDEWGNAGPLSNLPSESTLPPPTGQVDPTVITEELLTGEEADHTVTLTNVGVGTLDFTLPAPVLSEPWSEPAEPLELGKDELDPRSGDPVTSGQGGPDGFGYRWIDSNEAGGPSFSWTDISATGVNLGLTGDDQTSAPIALGFNVPFYGTLFDSIRVCTNGWLSFTSSATSYSNQPLPTSGAPENLVAPFWDDLHPRTGGRIYFEQVGNQAIVQWSDMERYSGAGTYTFQAIIDEAGSVTYQYLTLTGEVTSSTVGIQDASKTVGLQVAFNQAYLEENLAVRISAIPQWLSASPTSGRLHAGQSELVNLHMDASGLEGGHYPADVNILTNDPANPTLNVDVTLHVIGAPDAEVQPASLDYGDRFLGLPNELTLVVVNNGTDTLMVSDIVPSAPELDPQPRSFNVAPHSSANVTVTWTPSALGPFSGAVTVMSNDAAEPAIDVPCSGNGIPVPVMVVDPTSFDESLYTGNQLTRVLTVTNTGGSDLVVDAAVDLGDGVLISAPDEGTDGAGGPDAFGYKWKDSNESGGPAYDFVDISATGALLVGGGVDDRLSSATDMGMTFSFYGGHFTHFKASTNGWLTFSTSEYSSRYSNYNLPTTSGAANMVCAFWDDLHTRGGDLRWLNDGSRVIIQWTNVTRLASSTSPLTFQVQLYPNGKILLLYQSLTGTLTSATVGIQDGTKTIGLPVTYNQAYLEDGLAVQISHTPDWLAVAPSGAVIPPDGEFLFDVTFDSTDRNAGLLEGAVVLSTNIPGQEEERIPAALTVIGAPIIGIIPEEHDFGTQFTGYPYTTQFQVVNNGTDLLILEELYTTDPTLVVLEPTVDGDEQIPEAQYELPPGTSRHFELQWSPDTPAALLDAVRVVSNDPQTPVALMPVRGEAIPPPVAAWSPGSFVEDLMVGDVVHRTLHLENQGGSDLTFSAGVFLDSGVTVTVDHSPDLKKGEPDPNPGLLGTGGPDVFGYIWKDSDEPGGPTFDWIDISAVGTTIPFASSDDSNYGPIPIGFDFPFYENSYDTVRVSTNGFLSFTSTSSDLSNSLLPGTGSPENLLAVFHDDLHRRDGNATYWSDGTKFIVQFTDWEQYSPSTELYTFQVVLHRNGRIVYQYLSMTTGDLESATVGIQNAARDDGLTVVYNDPYVRSGLAVEFRPPSEWLSVSPEFGTVPAGGFIDLDVTIDVTELIGGDYSGSIDLTTNDPANAYIQVPVSLHATGIPDILATPDSLTFPTTFVGFDASLDLVIENVGTDVLHITDGMITGDFSQAGLSPPVDLPVGGTVPVTVTFAPSTDGTRSSELTVVSDDPDSPSYVIPLTGEGLFPPIIGSTPGSYGTALPPGGNRTKTLTIHNTGGSDLHWQSATNMISGTESVAAGSYLELGKEEEDPREGLLGSGGPDLFGYSWTDSDEPGGPAYEWVDISGIGTEIYFSGSGYCDDCTSDPIPIGFDFSFYGQGFNTLRACTNGWVSFTHDGNYYGNQPLPNAGYRVPENLLALFWDDLVLRSGTGSEPVPSAVYYHNDGTRFIIQYQHMYRIANYTDDLNFQVILYPSGRIVYQYETLSSSTLSSNTIGIQNETRDDGLNVVYNQSYVHESLAIQFQSIPEWVWLETTGGTIPAGGSQEVTVSFDAEGLEDGIHEATIALNSNDPYTPVWTIPVSLNVGLVTPTHTDFEPDVLNLSSNGKFVKMTVELPPDLDPYDIRLSSVFLNDTVPALENPGPEYTDRDLNDVIEVSFKFDRLAVEAILPEGTEVPVTIQGEVFDVQWWRGTDIIRTTHPRVTHPSGGEYYHAGQTIPIQWDPPENATPDSYIVQLSRNDEITWEEIGSGVTGTTFDWVATEPLTGEARIRVVAMDRGEVMGFDTNDGPFTIATADLQPPFPVEGGTLGVKIVGDGVQLEWAAPATDPWHGPADRYRILRGTDPAGTLPQVDEVPETHYQEPLSETGGNALTCYRIVAANAAGDAP